MPKQTLNNGELGSSFRSKLNLMFNELYQGGIAAAPTSTPTVDTTRMPAAQISPTTVNIGSGGLVISTPVYDKTYNVTAAIPSGTAAILLTGSGSLTRCVVNVNNNCDVGVHGGTVTDCDVRDANYANYYDTLAFGGVCVGRRGGQADFYLRNVFGTPSLPAGAMIKSISTKNWGTYMDTVSGAYMLGDIVAISDGSYTFLGSESGMAMDGCDNCTIASVVMNSLPGYVLAINNFSHHNNLGVVQGSGSTGDPGVVFANGSYLNTINLVDVSNVTVGVNFGEISDAGTGVTCPANRVVTLRGSNMPYGAVRFSDGDNCRVDVLTVSNAGSADVVAAIEFSPYNVVGVRPVAWCSVGRATLTGTTTRPDYGIHFGGFAKNNRVESANIASSIPNIAQVSNKGGISNTWKFDSATGSLASVNLTEGTAAPASGNWNQGDIVWNKGAAASGYAGWICVTAGNPGTWKTFGAISP